MDVLFPGLEKSGPPRKSGESPATASGEETEFAAELDGAGELPATDVALEAGDGAIAPTRADAADRASEPEPEVIDDTLDPLAEMIAMWTGTTATVGRVRASEAGAAGSQRSSDPGAVAMAGAMPVAEDTVPDGEVVLPATPDAEPGDAALGVGSETQDSGAIRLTRPQLTSGVTFSVDPPAVGDDAAVLAPAPVAEAETHAPGRIHTDATSRVVEAPPIIRQVVDAAIRSRGEVIEITLSPEELGRVRMVIGHQDRAPHLVIWADRPDTLDQLRRHADLLSEEFRQAGMEGAQLDYREGRGGRDWDEAPWAAVAEDATVANTPMPLTTVAVARAGMAPAGWGSRRIDIRI